MIYMLYFLASLTVQGIAVAEQAPREELNDTFIIRPATHDDLPAIVQLDTAVSFEYFKPIFVKYYSEFSFGKNPDECLQKEVAADTQVFLHCVTNHGNARLHIAYDNKNKCIAGFILFHKNDHTLEIDLLFVEAHYRRHGIGRKLLADALQTFKDVDNCLLYTLHKGNDATHKFYEKLGFTRFAGSPHEKNIYGVPHADMYVYYMLTIKKLN